MLATAVYDYNGQLGLKKGCVFVDRVYLIMNNNELAFPESQNAYIALQRMCQLKWVEHIHNF